MASRLARMDRAALLTAVAVTVGAAALVLFANRGLYFWQDEWDFISGRSQLRPYDYFAPQNQNFLSTTVLAYQVLVGLFGIESYLPFRLMPAAMTLVLGVLAYAYARRHVGPWWALAPLGFILVNPGAEIVVWPFQVAQTLSLACGLGALLLLDAAEQGRRRTLGVSGLLMLGVASSSLGVPIAAVVAYDRLLTPGRRREVLLVAPAAALYVAWYLKYGRLSPFDNELDWPQLNAALQRAVEIGNGHLGFFVGATDWPPGALVGRLGLIVLVILVCWHAFGPRAEGRARTLALAGALATYWALLAWGRAVTPGLEFDDRYLYGGHALLTLLAMHLAVVIRAALRELPAPRGTRRVALGAGAVIVALVTLQAVRDNAAFERTQGHELRAHADAIHGQIRALDALTPAQRDAQPFYVNAITLNLGRPADIAFDRLPVTSDSEIDDRIGELSRAQAGWADRRFAAMYVEGVADPAAAPAAAGPRPALRALPGGGARVEPASRSCTRIVGSTNTSNVEVAEADGPLVVQNLGAGLGEVFVRRFAGDWTGPARTRLDPGATVTVRFEVDRASLPWQLRISGQDIRVCSIAGPAASSPTTRP